jgi:hypothetical protein
MKGTPLALAVSILTLTLIGVASLYGALTPDAASSGASMFAGPFIGVVLFVITAVDLVVIWTIKWRVREGVWLAAFGAALALAIAGAELRQTYPAGSRRSFPRAFQEVHLKNFNLTESLLLARNLRQGRGNTLPKADGTVEIDTYRMPGYAMFVAAAAALRSAPEDLLGLAISAVYAQVWAFALGLGCFAYCAVGSVGMRKAAVMVAGAAWFPQSFDLTQADSVILTCGLLIAAALCAFHSSERRAEDVPLGRHLLVHAAFALYFLMRSDVIVGWLGVSLFLYWKRPRWLILPLIMFLLVGGSWGLYKKRHGSDFVMTTSNQGHVAFVGLWQTLPHRFIWEPNDESYVRWIGEHGYRYTEPRTDRFAVREVLRFWLTYPGFVAANAWYRIYSYFRYWAWSGSLALFSSRVFGVIARRFAWWFVFAACIAALLTRFDLPRTFLLAWPLVLNLPLFWILQFNGRYLDFVSCSVMFTAVSVMLDPRFWQSIGGARRQLVLWGLVGTVWLSAPLITHAVFTDRFRYWTPLLDPSESTLNVER